VHPLHLPGPSTSAPPWALTLCTSLGPQVRRFDALGVQRFVQLAGVAAITGLLWWQRGAAGTLQSAMDVVGLLFFELLFPVGCAAARGRPGHRHTLQVGMARMYIAARVHVDAFTSLTCPGDLQRCRPCACPAGLLCPVCRTVHLPRGLPYAAQGARQRHVSGTWRVAPHPFLWLRVSYTATSLRAHSSNSGGDNLCPWTWRFQISERGQARAQKMHDTHGAPPIPCRYRVSAYYMARMASDLPMDCAYPTLFMVGSGAEVRQPHTGRSHAATHGQKSGSHTQEEGSPAAALHG
jgi:hypothetical protein